MRITLWIESGTAGGEETEAKSVFFPRSLAEFLTTAEALWNAQQAMAELSPEERRRAIRSVVDLNVRD